MNTSSQQTVRYPESRHGGMDTLQSSGVFTLLAPLGRNESCYFRFFLVCNNKSISQVSHAIIIGIPGIQNNVESKVRIHLLMLALGPR